MSNIYLSRNKLGGNNNFILLTPKSLYGIINFDSWNVTDGVKTEISSIKYIEKPIYEVTDIYQYLSELKNYSFIISARDDAADSWNETLQQLLEELGLKGAFKHRDSYIAIVENNKVLNEQVSHAPLEYTNRNIYIRSAGYDTGVSDSIIAIDGCDYSIKSRGLNIVVLDNGGVIDSVAFDTWDKLLRAKRN